jgi:replicative DNA helicase
MNDQKTRKRTITQIGALVNEIGKLPPQAVELEEAVLGAMLLESEALNTVVDILTPESFYKEQNSKVYNAIINLFKINEPVDILTVTQELRRTGELEFVGGSYYVSALTNRIASSANIEFHARIVAQKFISRELIRIGTQSIRAAYEEGADPFELLDEHEKQITGIVAGLNVSKGTKSDKLFSDLLERNHKIVQNPNSVVGVETGFVELNNLMRGWQPSDLVLLAARPGQGKTALALCLAKNAVLSGVPTAIYSLEMSEQQLYRRLAAQETQIPHELIKNGMDASTEALFKRDMEKLRTAPLFIDDAGGLTVFELRNKARKQKREENIGLIIIDYLQLMSGTGKEGNREQEISVISRSLKSLAKELNIPIIALSQLSREVEKRPGKKPQLSDLRDSGSLEQDADMVFFIYNPETYGITHDEDGNSTKGIVQLINAKNRHGAAKEIYLKWASECMLFLDQFAAGPSDLEEKQNNSEPLSNNNDFLNQNN